MPDRLGRLRRRLSVLLRWRAHQAELREEIAQHAALRQREFEGRGLTPDEAAAATARAMGNITMQREEARRVWSPQWAESVYRDVLFALRSMARAPGFTAVAVLGLAGGLGFGAAAFSAVNALAYRGWNVPNPSSVVALFATSTAEPGNRRASGFSYDQMQAFASRARTLTAVAAYERTRPDGSGEITASPVSAAYFGVMAIPMQRGRPFLPEEDRIGAPTAVIVLSHAWWTTRMNAAPDVIGQAVRVRGIPFTVIGVAAPGFEGTDLAPVDAWIPLTAHALVRPKDRISTTSLAQSDACCVHVVARLSPGFTREQAAEELTVILAQTMRPGVDTLVRRATVNPFTVIGSAGPDVGGEVTPVFAMIFAGVGIVLLLACANVANLLLARGAARERELSIRLALGASRGRLVRQLMTESLVLALAASVPALVIAQVLPEWIMRILAGGATTLRFAPDSRVLAVVFGLCVLSCVAFGLAPALHATRSPTARRDRVPLRSLFLSAQVTFCVVLLVAAGLFLRSAQAGRRLEMGFSHDDLTEIAIAAPANADDALLGTRLSIELPELVATSGLSAAYTESAPFAVGDARVNVDAAGPEIWVPSVSASPEYFALLRMTMLTGRPFAPATLNGREVVINAVLADRLGGAGQVVGRTLMIDSVPHQVVGVVATARDVRDLRQLYPAVYRSYPWSGAPRVLVRGPAAEVRRLADAIRAREPDFTVSTRPYAWYIENTLAGQTGAASMAGALGALALALAAVGIFGVFAFWVQQRQRDIGVRIALGATRRDILALLLRATARALGWGVLAGVLLAGVVALVLRKSLYGLSPFDPASFGGALGILVLAAILATLWPAWRATRVDPMQSMRAD